MTLEQFRSLNPKELEVVSTAIHSLDFTYPAELTFDIETYYKNRYDSRKANITWPEKLSKKEVVICKLTFLHDMLKAASSIESTDPKANSDHMFVINMLIIFVKSIEKDCYRPPIASAPSPDTGKVLYTKYEGIPADVAPTVNDTFKVLNKIYRKKFKI
jgi:hypothetical protein